MPSRRFHQKRRQGCESCKQRKIRCGEEQPACYNCVKWGARCSFLGAGLQGNAAPLWASSLSQVPINVQSQHVFAHFDHQDAQLLAHYSLSVCSTTTDEMGCLPSWRITIPNLALSSSYLRHGLLALSAMHVRSGSSPDRQSCHLGLARQHLAKALESYIPQLEINTEETCPSLFAFSVILPVLSYSLLKSVDTKLQGAEYIKHFVRIWKFLLGATTVARGAQSWIHRSSLSALVTLRSLDNMVPHLADDPQTALQALLDQAELVCPSSTIRSDEQSPQPFLHSTNPGSIYRHSIEMLSNSFPASTGKPPQLAAVIGWPVFIDKQFFQLLRLHDPMALVILAYYGRALHPFSGFWWLQGLGFRLVEAVAHILGEEYHPLLQWPLQGVGLMT